MCNADSSSGTTPCYRESSTLHFSTRPTPYINLADKNLHRAKRQQQCVTKQQMEQQLHSVRAKAATSKRVDNAAQSTKASANSTATPARRLARKPRTRHRERTSLKIAVVKCTSFFSHVATENMLLGLALICYARSQDAVGKGNKRVSSPNVLTAHCTALGWHRSSNRAKISKQQHHRTSRLHTHGWLTL